MRELRLQACEFPGRECLGLLQKCWRCLLHYRLIQVQTQLVSHNADHSLCISILAILSLVYCLMLKILMFLTARVILIYSDWKF